VFQRSEEKRQGVPVGRKAASQERVSRMEDQKIESSQCGTIVSRIGGVPLSRNGFGGMPPALGANATVGKDARNVA
jgi:hypothetical protein